MSADLKPCPFCGGSNVVLTSYDVQPDNYHAGHAYCNDCEMEGPSSLSLPEPDGYWMPDADSAKEEGAKAWNRRSDASLSDAQAEISRLRGAFSSLLEMVEQHADFANGVTDPTGTIDEGRVIAAEQLRKFQEVLK